MLLCCFLSSSLTWFAASTMATRLYLMASISTDSGTSSESRSDTCSAMDVGGGSDVRKPLVVST